MKWKEEHLFFMLYYCKLLAIKHLYFIVIFMRVRFTFFCIIKLDSSMSKKNQVNGAFFWTTRLKTIPNWQMSQEQCYSTIQLHKNSTSRLDTLQRPITQKEKKKDKEMLRYFGQTVGPTNTPTDQYGAKRSRTFKWPLSI